jgi:hypothetical protein
MNVIGFGPRMLAGLKAIKPKPSVLDQHSDCTVEVAATAQALPGRGEPIHDGPARSPLAVPTFGSPESAAAGAHTSYMAPPFVLMCNAVAETFRNGAAPLPSDCSAVSVIDELVA